MEIELSPEDAQTAEEWVAAGRFSSVEEVVHASLQKMRDEQEWSEYARDRIEAGLADIEAGRTIPMEDFLAEVKARHEKAA